MLLDPGGVSAHISAMCLSSDALTNDVGQVLRQLETLHVRRADDGRCDSDGSTWPCWTSMQILTVASHFEMTPS